MSLDATAIAALATDLKNAKIACGAMENAALDTICLAEATAIVNCIKNHAVVTPLLLVAPPGGGPVTGTGTLT